MTIADLLEDVVQGPVELDGRGPALFVRPTLETTRAGRFPSQALVVTSAARRMIELSRGGERVRAIVVEGDPDPTRHPDFPEVSGNLRELRDKWFGKATLVLEAAEADLASPSVRNALRCYDEVRVRLEAGSQKIFTALTGEAPQRFKDLVEGLSQTEHRNVVVLARFVRGEVDNSADRDVRSWLRVLGEVRPARVLVSTPKKADGKRRPITKTRLGQIESQVAEKLGVPVEIVPE